MNPDRAAGDFDEQKRVAFVIFNHGQRLLGDAEALPGGRRPPYAVGVADLNRNGRPDIVASTSRRLVQYQTNAGPVNNRSGTGTMAELRWAIRVR